MISEQQKFRIERITNDKTWDDFIEASPQGSAFALSSFLAGMGASTERWFLFDGERALAAALLATRDSQVLAAPQPFSIYQGLFLSELVASPQAHSRSRLVLECLGEFMRLLEAKYGRLSFCLHPSLTDLRALQWHNFHSESGGKFEFQLRYTGILNLGSYESFEIYLRAIRNTRRQEYQKALRSGLTAEQSSDIQMLRHLQEKTFARQGINLAASLSEQLVSIVDSVHRRGKGELYICRLANGEIASATFFMKFGSYAYYLIGANDPDHRKTNSGTFLILENIRRFFESNVKFVDMVGINSPNRGDFKTSFDAEPVPYFEAHLAMPKSSPTN